MSLSSLERRRNSRHFWSARLGGRALPSAEDHANSGATFRAEILNVSSGGIGILTSQEVKELDLVRAEIFPSTLPAGVPSLLQVRWVERMTSRSEYRVGLQFLLAWSWILLHPVIFGITRMV